MGEALQPSRGDKTAAGLIGLPVEEYMSRRALGFKWCTRCKDWHVRAAFARDASRHDGLKAACSPMRVRPLRTEDEKRAIQNAGYRRRYKGASGAVIRARVYARKRNTSPIDPEMRALLMDLFEGLCVYCTAPAATIDHALAVKNGGDARRGNLLPSCGSCNSRKGTRDFDEFYLECQARGMQVNDYALEELAMEFIL